MHKIISLCILPTLCTTFCVSHCEPFRHTINHNFKRLTGLVLRSLPIHALFPTLLCTLSAYFCITFKRHSWQILFNVMQGKSITPSCSNLLLLYSVLSLALAGHPASIMSSNSHLHKRSLLHVLLSSTTSPLQKSLIVFWSSSFPLQKSRQAGTLFRRSSQFYKR